ncbi:hypothetical protein BD770DRAFT_473563 [Pilaira anomala]|nr:hypothetical protein BD770DRAFT_473563 [Pilaira anomala]
MYSRLVEDTTKRNIIEEVPVFQATAEGYLWTCPFCDPESIVYQLHVPPSSEVENLRKVKLLIKDHVELHKKDLLSQVTARQGLAQYEKARKDSLKRVRLWITGTIKDRRLYEDDPL